MSKNTFLKINENINITSLEHAWEWDESMSFTRFYDDPIDPNMDIRGKLTEFLRTPGIFFTNASVKGVTWSNPNGFEIALSGYHSYNNSVISVTERGIAIQASKPMMAEYCPLKIKDVIFNDPATIVFWGDGTKTVVKCENEEFDKEKGLAMAYMKKMLGNKGRYFNEVKKWTRRDK